VTSVRELVLDLGGMAQKQQLVARGVRGFHLTAAVRSGDVVRVRNGWYSTFEEEDARLRAVRVGGRLTGLSALQILGAWTFGRVPLHVSLHENAARMRKQSNRHERLRVTAPDGVVLHWDDAAVRYSGTVTSVSVADALISVISNEDFETSIAVIDWALQAQVVDTLDLYALVERLPLNRRGIVDWVDERCESLPESLTRTRLRLAGHSVESQVRLGDLQRIDLVVDGQIGIEVDGDEFHWDRFGPDRGKDIDITLQHLHAMRPSARSVFYQWPKFAAAVDIALADRGFYLQNSGPERRHPFANAGLSGWMNDGIRSSPEF
jgi:hypothetical protein